MTPVAGGFRLAGVAAGVIVLVLNDGPLDAAAAAFGPADPSPWSEPVVADGRVRAAVLCPAGLAAATGPDGFAVTHRSAEQVAAGLTGIGAETSAVDVVVCSTGPAAPRLGEPELRSGIAAAITALGNGHAPRLSTLRTAAARSEAGWGVAGMSSAACIVMTVDAVVDAAGCRAALAGVPPAGGTLLVMASGAARVVPDPDELAALLAAVRRQLAEPALAAG